MKYFKCWIVTLSDRFAESIIAELINKGFISLVVGNKNCSPQEMVETIDDIMRNLSLCRFCIIVNDFQGSSYYAPSNVKSSTTGESTGSPYRNSGKSI